MTGPFAAPPTFMGVPATRNLVEAGAKVAVIGLPFDCGTHPVRIGSRLGPAAIREQSALVRRYEPPHRDFDPVAALNLVDCGDADVVPSAIGPSHDAMERALRHVVDAGALTLAMGGDGAVSLPHMRALRARHADLCVIHIDAHTDTYPSHGTEERDLYNVATTFTRAAEEGLVDLARSFHIGARGTTSTNGVFDYTRQKGYRLIDGAELSSRGDADVVAEMRARIEGRPVFLCFDMDFFDPSCAPGVCTPTWGGALSREGLALIQALAGLRFAGFEVNTVSPPHDVGGMTAFLAAACMHQFLFLACRSPDIALLPPRDPF